MTNLSEKTTDELWAEVEMWFDGIESTLACRCYSNHSLAGARSIQLTVSGHLTWIDQALCEIEERLVEAARQRPTTPPPS